MASHWTQIGELSIDTMLLSFVKLMNGLFLVGVGRPLKLSFYAGALCVADNWGINFMYVATEIISFAPVQLPPPPIFASSFSSLFDIGQHTKALGPCTKTFSFCCVIFRLVFFINENSRENSFKKRAVRERKVNGEAMSTHTREGRCSVCLVRWIKIQLVVSFIWCLMVRRGN